MSVMAMNLSEEKNALRKQVIARRDAMDFTERQRKSERICQRAVEQLCGRFAERSAQDPVPVVGLFSALGSEVDLRGVVRAACVQGWKIALPLMVKQDEAPGFTMVFVEVDDQSALLREEAFLAKPAKSLDPADFDFVRFPLIEPEALDALLIPLVAFDAEGGRLGYGGGNYDRYLPRLRQDCWLAGVAFDEQQVPRVPRAGFDRALPQIIHA